MKKVLRISTEEFDRRFDDGEDVSDYIDFASARRINDEMDNIDVELPHSMVCQLDAEATRLGLSRQSLVQTWLTERLSADRMAS